MSATAKDLLDELLDGWREPVRYATTVRMCTPECEAVKRGLTIDRLRHYSCGCPRRTTGHTSWPKQLPLLTQLVEAGYRAPGRPKDAAPGTMPNKPRSRPPGDLLRPDELLGRIHAAANDVCAEWGAEGCVCGNAQVWRNRCAELALRHLAAVVDVKNEDEREQLRRALAPVVRECRIFLGYEGAAEPFDEPCAGCGGPLQLAPERWDHPLQVECADCPATYPLSDWLTEPATSAVDERAAAAQYSPRGVSLP